MRVEARIAGALYWSVIAGGLFAGAVQSFLTVPSDPAATAQAIAAYESLWRWGIGVHLVYLAGPAIIMDVLLYRIFKHVQPTLALLALASALTAGAVEGAALLQLYVPLAVGESSDPLAALGEGQRQALAYLAIRLYDTGSGFALLFFSGFCAATGVLILRSRLLTAPTLFDELSDLEVHGVVKAFAPDKAMRLQNGSNLSYRPAIAAVILIEIDGDAESVL